MGEKDIQNKIKTAPRDPLPIDIQLLGVIERFVLRLYGYEPRD